MRYYVDAGILTLQAALFDHMNSVEVEIDVAPIVADHPRQRCLATLPRSVDQDRGCVFQRVCEAWLAKNAPNEYHAVDEIRQPPAWLGERATYRPAALPAPQETPVKAR